MKLSSTYQICLKGHLSDHLSDYLQPFNITLNDYGNTVLTGSITDQAELFGLLKKIRDLGLTLLSLNCIEPKQNSETEFSND